MSARLSQATELSQPCVPRRSARRCNLWKPTPRRRQPIPNPAAAIRCKRLEAGGETWCRRCGTGCGAPPEPAANHFPIASRLAPRPSIAGSVAPNPQKLLALSPLAHPVPGLPAAEDSAEDAALNPQDIRALHRDGGIVSLAAVRIVNSTSPFLVRRLHVDENLLAVRNGKSAKVLAALLYANHPPVFFRVPYAERRRRRLNRRGGNSRFFSRLFRRGARSYRRYALARAWRC